jgi:uncharacterized protein
MTAQLTGFRSPRIESIDVLRGFTLFGIIIVHTIEQYYAGMWPKQYANANTDTIADSITSAFSGIFISGKFYMIFSFLFGLSFYIQFSKSDSEKNFLLRFAWRLTILFVIGFIHHLHYRGDILTIYAMLGLCLLVFYRLPDKYLLWLAAFLILNIPSVITRGIQGFLATENKDLFPQNDQDLITYFNTLKSGSYLNILQANYHEFAGKMQFQVFSGRLYITLGLFLLGIYAGRKKFFENVTENIPFLKKTIRYALWTILGSIVFSAIIFGGAFALKFSLPNVIGYMIGGFAFDVFNTCLSAIYVAWILLLYQKDKWQKRLYYLYPVGRMGLTTYLMQTLLGTFVFFSYGLHLLADIGATACFGLAIVFFAFQIAFARFWFRYFTFGPVEWLWRNLTYLKIQPMVVERAKVVSN